MNNLSDFRSHGLSDLVNSQQNAEECDATEDEQG